MNRRMSLPTVLPVVLMAVAIAVTGCGKLIGTGNTEPDKPGSLPKIKVTEVVAGDLNRDAELAATIEGYEMAELMPRIDGYVGKVNVNIGDRVKKGTVLATLEVPELADRVLQKQELIKQSEAEVASKRAEVALARSKLAALQANLKMQKLAHNRIKELVAKGSLNEQLLDEAAFALESAAAQLKQGEANVQAAEAHVDAAVAMRDVAEADRKMAETMAAYRDIRAPFDGLITARTVDPGAYVRPASNGGTSMFRIARVDKVRVVVFVPLALASYVSEDDTAVVHDLPALPGHRIEWIAGEAVTISRFANSFDAGSRLMRVEIDIDNEALYEAVGVHLKPGDYGRVTLTLERLAGFPMVPRSAVGTNERGEKYVIRLGTNNTFQKLLVNHVLLENSTHAVLNPNVVGIGDRVVESDLDQTPLDVAIEDDQIDRADDPPKEN